jgi:mannosyltransferase
VSSVRETGMIINFTGLRWTGKHFMGKRGSYKKKPVDGADKDNEASSNQIRPFYKKPVYLVLSAIILLAFILRFFDLGKESLWLDESSSYYLTNVTSPGEVWTNAFNDRHPPLYNLALWAVRILGSNEFWLRFPSACAGVATIVVIFFLAREITNEKVGLISALLLAVSPFDIYYSQEARMYAFAVLFVALAYYAFFKACKSRQWFDWTLFGVACAAAFYSHFYTAFAIMTMFIGYFIMRIHEFDFSKWNGKIGSINSIIPNDFKMFVLGDFVAFVLVLPIIGSFLHQNQYFSAHTFNWGLDIWSIPFATFSDFSFSNDIVAVVFIILMCLGLVLLWRLNSLMTITLGILLFIPVVISMYMSSSIPFNVRYHLYLLPLFLVIVGIGIERLVGYINKNKGVYVALTLIILLSIMPLAAYYSNFQKEDWRGFSANLQNITHPGDIIVPLPGYMIQPLEYYYSNQSDGTFIKYINSYNVSGFNSINNETGAVYFVVTWDIQAADPSGYSLQYLNSHTQQQPGSVSGIYLLKKVN